MSETYNCNDCTFYYAEIGEPFQNKFCHRRLDYDDDEFDMHCPCDYDDNEA